MAELDTDSHATESERSLVSSEVQEDSNSPVAASIRKMMRERPRIPPNCFIFRVPADLRYSKEELYDPKVVSIGPLHRGKEELQAMERLKLDYLEAFLARTSVSVETFVKKIQEWENEIRDCYEEPIKLSSDEFVKMVLFDSCFVIEIIGRHWSKERGHLSHLRLVTNFWGDMMLAENQLPFFVLRGLFDLAFPDKISTSDCFLNLCLRFVAIFSFWNDAGISMEDMSEQQQSKIKHLLHLLRVYLAPSIPRGNPPDSFVDIAMPKATELEESGMVIEPHIGCQSGMDICYTPGVLKIPKFFINEKTECVLVNLLAFEFFFHIKDSYLSDYIQFMDILIDNNKDVDVLTRNGIIITGSATDSQRVATLLNNIRCDFNLTNYFYYGIQEQVKAYCKTPYHRWRASLRRDYCSSPWIIASTAAALILLFLTLIQTICSIFSVI